MNFQRTALLLFLLLFTLSGIAQKPLTEGFILYKVKLESPDNKIFTGTYTFTFKGGQLRKDLKLTNGYQHVLIINATANIVYSLQSRNGRKYAVELNLQEIIEKQGKYANFTLANEKSIAAVAGCAAFKATIGYKDGSTADICYTKEWQPPIAMAYNRYPGALFMPLVFSYKDDDGIIMHFEAEKVVAEPVENATFRIPPDYMIISNAEYKQMLNKR